MSPLAPSLLALAGAGLAAGAMNAVAGGGSFVSLPALVAAGLPSTIANTASTVALLPGTMASAWAYRLDARPIEGAPLKPMFAISIAGGAAGALLLLFTPPAAFDRIVPWLLLVALVAFTFGRQLGAWLRARMRIGAGLLLALQAVLAVYGGYFGGGVGIMMMAAWGLLFEVDLRTLNPLRMAMVAATNLVAAACFVIAGAVRWPEALAMLAGATAGGYGGAWVARRLPQGLLRGVIITVAATMTALFFWRAYGPR